MGNYIKPKIIFFDIDGTLVDMTRKKITPLMLETLRGLKANGIKICIATGRTPVTVPKFEVEFDAYLTFNGSYCYEGATEIFSLPLSKEDTRQILENAERLGRPVSIATKNRVVANGTDTDLTDYFGIGNLVPNISKDFAEEAEKEVYQVMLGCRAEDYDRILEGTREAKVAAWWDRAADVIPAGGGKGSGIGQMLAYYGFDRSEAMAFGDGNNDIEMFQAVGHGVAMGNASDDLKAIAEEVCGTCAEDGIYHYCMEKGLIG